MTQIRAERRVRLASFVFAALVLASCTSPNSARGVTDRFIAAHYMAIDPKRRPRSARGWRSTRLTVK